VKEEPHVLLAQQVIACLPPLASSRAFSFRCQVLGNHINPGGTVVFPVFRFALVQSSYLAVSTYLNCSSLFSGSTQEKAMTRQPS